MKKEELIKIKKAWVEKEHFEETVKWAKTQEWNKEEISQLGEDNHEHCEICSIALKKIENKYTDGHAYLCEYCYTNFVKEK